MNSVFVLSGRYSCAVDCFSEVSGYLFLPELSKLTKRSEFPELLFTAASNYRNQGRNVISSYPISRWKGRFSQQCYYA